MIPIHRHRLLRRGELPYSDGGIYNPGAWVDPADGRVKFVSRVESDYLFQPESLRPCSFTLLENGTLTRYQKPNLTGACIHWTDHPRLPLGFADDLRFEDLRPFVYGDALLVVGVRWKPAERWTYPVKPVTAVWNYPAGMALSNEMTLPIACRPMEKNWVLLTHDGRLCLVYSLSPLTIFARVKSGWTVYRHDANDWEAQAGAHLKNSTHLLPFRGGYLGFWHLHRQGENPRVSYETGAYWLDKTLKFYARTGPLFDGREVVAAPDIYKPGVLYISSYVFRGDDVLVFYGEGDSHTGVATLAQADLAHALGID